MAHLEWTDDAGHVVAIRFDSVQSVEHSQTALVTRHPVERGADIADHVRPELPTVTLTGTVSNTPLFAVSELQYRDGNRKAIGSYQQVELAKSPGTSRASALQGGFLDAINNAIRGPSGPAAVDALVFENLSSRVKQITTILTDALEASRLIKFVDEARDYENMVIESKAIVRTAEGGKACSVTLTLSQIKVVESAVVDSPIPSELRGQLATAAGSAAAKLGANQNVDEKKREQTKSLAASLFDGAAGLF
jgi:hypothetical protein